jgi:hypothetical protein
VAPVSSISPLAKEGNLTNIQFPLGEFLQLTIWGVIEPSVTIMAASVPAMRVLFRNTVAKRQRLLDEKEEEGFELKSNPHVDNPSSSRVATWGTKFASWASTVATWGSVGASRACRP